MMSIDDKTREAAGFLSKELKDAGRIGIVLGSGLGGLADEIQDTKVWNFGEIPHFPVSSVEGHRGQLIAGSLCGVEVLAMAGRVHFYEGFTMKEVSFPVRVMGAMGVKNIIITNAGGAANSRMTPGDIALIEDHINLMGDNPLRGSPDFTDLTSVYSDTLKELARRAAENKGIELKSGVYVGNQGPSYETPAEVRMARIMGGDIVGMSTVPEVITASSCGMSVLGLSMITNMAAGITGEKLSHREVIATTESAQEEFKTLVREILALM